MPKPLKVAVVGTNIGCTLHVRALRRAGFEVTALVGRDPERTRKRADHFNIPGALTSFDATLDSDIDAICIATPPSSHYPFTVKAFKAGKHVLLEKPFTLELGHAYELRDMARETGLVHQLCNQLRWFQPNATLRHLVRSGVLGTPTHVHWIGDHPLVVRNTSEVPTDWWLDNASGGGWLRNYGSHAVDLIRYAVDEFTAVSAALHNDLSRNMKADDGYAFAFRLANGAIGSMSATCRSWDNNLEFRVVGTAGTAINNLGTLTVADKDGRRTVPCPPEVLELLRAGGDDPGAPVEKLPAPGNYYEEVHTKDAGYAEQVALCRAFAHRIADRSYTHPAVADFNDGIAHMELIYAIEKSAETGRWVDVKH